MLNKGYVDLLKAPFPKEKIKSRRGQGGVFQYIDGIEVENRLNEVFQGNWEWEVTSYDYITIPNWILCFGKLTVRTLAEDGNTIILTTKSGEGAVKYTSNDDISLRLKSASTKALKAAASRFGIAREIEAVEDEGPFTGQTVQRERETVMTETSINISPPPVDPFEDFVQEPRNDEKLTPSQLTALIARAQMLGKTAKQLMMEGLGLNENSVPDAFEDLSRAMAKELLIATNPYK